MRPGYINLSPRDASMMKQYLCKGQTRSVIVKEQKAQENVSYAFFNSDWPIVQVEVPKLEKLEVSSINENKNLRKSTMQLILEACALFMTLQVLTSVLPVNWFRISWKQKL